MPLSKLLVLAALTVLALPGCHKAREADLLPPPDTWVTDSVGVLSAESRSRLNRDLEEHQRQTGQQVLLWIGRSTGGADVDDWAASTFSRWKVGRAGLNDGVVIFMVSDARRVRIEVGYGLEQQLTDAVAGRILRDVVIPRLQAGDWNGAATNGVAAVLSALAASGSERDGPNVPTWLLALTGGVFFSVVLLLAGAHPPLALLLQLLSMMGRGSRGGPGSSRKGIFRGGGGRSGGGGASGRW